MENSIRNHKFEALDGLRGVFALLIALGHFHVVGHFFYLPLVRVGLGVDFFFVLSGFVITHATMGTLNNAKDIGIFTLRRFGRVWPLHAAVLLGFLVPFEVLKMFVSSGAEIVSKYPAFAPGGPTSISAIFTNLALIQALGVHDTNTWNGPAWSISTEFYTYILFALLAVAVPRFLTPITATLALASALLLFYFVPNIHVQYDYGFLRCVFGFFTGHLLYKVFIRAKSASKEKLAYPMATELMCVLLVVSFITVAAFTKLSILAPLAFALPVYVFACQEGPVSRWLCSRPLQFLGLISYSIYITFSIVRVVFERAVTLAEKLLHTPLTRIEPKGYFNNINMEVMVLGNPWVMDLLAVGYMAAVITLAYFATRFIESPCRAWFNNLAKKLSSS